MNAGELIKELEKYPKNTKIAIGGYHGCVDWHYEINEVDFRKELLPNKKKEEKVLVIE